jgi:hypothetical protein
MRPLLLTLLSLIMLVTAGGLVACQQSAREPAEPAEAEAESVTKAPVVSDSLFLGLIFPYAPPKPTGPVTQAALLMTRQGAPIEQVTLGTFDGRAIVLDSLAERGFPDSTLLGFRTLHRSTGTDVAVLRANDTTLHVLSRPVRDTASAADFHLLKKVFITAHSHVRIVR